MKQLPLMLAFAACGATSTTPPQPAPVHGRLPADVIQRIVYANRAPFTRCYDEALKKNRSLVGQELFAPRSRDSTLAERALSAQNVLRYGSEAPSAFDHKAAEAALRNAALAIQFCAKRSGPKGRGFVTVVFDPSGRVSSAKIDPPFAGTETGA